jgi:hypothetical protein
MPSVAPTRRLKRATNETPETQRPANLAPPWPPPSPCAQVSPFFPYFSVSPWLCGGCSLDCRQDAETRESNVASAISACSGFAFFFVFLSASVTPSFDRCQDAHNPGQTSPRPQPSAPSGLILFSSASQR